MADYSSELPIRSQLPGQSLPDDVIIKIGDGTNPTTQFAAVDTHGSLSSVIKDTAGNAIGDQLLSTTYWLQTVQPSNGPVAPGTAASFSELIGGQYNSTLPTLTTGQQSAIQVNSNGILLVANEPDFTPATQPITAQDIASTSTAVYNQTWFSGTPTAGSTASFTLNAQETGMIEVTGTWTGTLQIEVSVDGGTNWIAHAVHLLGSTIFTATATGNFMGSINVAAKTNVRVRATSAWTGTAIVRINESLNPSSIYVANALKLVDGSSATSQTLMNILAASTAASTTNTAIVVALSPNTPLPAGTNLLGSVNQGTSPWVTSDLADGSVTGGSAATKSMLGGLVFNTAAPTLTNAQQAALQGDAAGNLKVNLQTALPAGANNIGSVNQGTSPWITSDLADGSVTGGTAGSKSMLGGGQYNTVAPTLTNAQQAALQLDVNGNLKVDLATPIPAGTNAIGSVLANLQVANAPVTVANPVPVTITSGSAGTPIQQYLTSVALAKNNSVTLTYTVPAGHTFSLERIWASASGKIKVVVQNGATNIFAAFNSTANPNIDFTITAPPTIAAAGTVNVIITNIDNAAMDVYATVEGNQIT